MQPNYVVQFVDIYMGEVAEVVQLFNELEEALKWLNGHMERQTNGSARVWTLGSTVPLEYVEILVRQLPPPPKVVKGYKLASTIR